MAHWKAATPATVGNQDDSQAGYSVAIVGDVNGDGYDDLLTGAPGNDEITNYAGMIFLNLGGPHGWQLSIDSYPFLSDRNFDGETNGDRAGFSVAEAGDVNGDGFDDMLIGAPYWQGQDGRVYLLLGHSNIGSGMDLNLRDADVVYTGAGGEQAGFSLAGTGDMNGDGYDDFFNWCSCE